MKLKVTILAACIIGGLLAFGAGLAWWKHSKSVAAGHSGGGGFEPSESVQVVQAHTITWRPTASMVGTVFALRSVTVSNEVAGTVKEIRFDSGSVVEQGDLLLTLDTSTEEADLHAAEAAINMSTASRAMIASSVQLADSRLRRVAEAMEHRAASAMDTDQAKSELDTAKANLDRMSAELEQSKARADQVRALIEKKRIRAPFKARAGIRTIHPGQYLKEGSEIVSLQGIDDRIYLDFALPQEEAWRVKPNAVFMATSAMLGKEPVRIEVKALDSQVSMTTRNVRVRAIVDNPGDLLRAGMSVEVSVPIDEPQEYVAVPILAVRHATYGDHVFVIGPSTVEGEPADKLRAKQRFVTLGPTIGDEVIVKTGLKAGERIASVGSFKLREGALVLIAPPSPPPEVGSAASAASPKP
jgi:membrane fusion protein, multidrug efflux system